MREIFEVQVEPDDYEVPALVLSALTWPAVSEAQGRQRLYLSLCSWFIRDRAARDSDWASERRMIHPTYACRSEADIHRDLRTFERRFKDRAVAGHMAIAFLQEAQSGVTPKLPGEMKRLSINQMAEHLQSELGVADAGNLESRVWRPSLPVIHLCAAWATCAQEHFKTHGERPVLDPVMRDPEFLSRLLHRAMLYEPLLERSRLKIPPDSLIRFRLQRGGFKKNPVS